eukprot:7785083-Pyramimonas_sp.AAC.1
MTSCWTEGLLKTERLTIARAQSDADFLRSSKMAKSRRSCATKLSARAGSSINTCRRGSEC